MDSGSLRDLDDGGMSEKDELDTFLPSSDPSSHHCPQCETYPTSERQLKRSRKQVRILFSVCVLLMASTILLAVRLCIRTKSDSFDAGGLSENLARLISRCYIFADIQLYSTARRHSS